MGGGQRDGGYTAGESAGRRCYACCRHCKLHVVVVALVSGRLEGLLWVRGELWLWGRVYM